MGWVVDTYVGVGVREEQRVGKQREFVEWQVAHFQKKLQIKKKKTERKGKEKWEEVKRKQWKMHINFERQTVSEEWRGTEEQLPHSYRGGSSWRWTCASAGASGRARWCQCIPKLAPESEREKSIKKKLSEKRPHPIASYSIASYRVEYLKTHLLRNIFLIIVYENIPKQPSRMSHYRIYKTGQWMRLFH